jgi:hypothetical protein
MPFTIHDLRFSASYGKIGKRENRAGTHGTFYDPVVAGNCMRTSESTVKSEWIRAVLTTTPEVTDERMEARESGAFSCTQIKTGRSTYHCYS